MFGNMSVAYRAVVGSASSADLCTTLVRARQKIAEDKIHDLRVACAQKDACIQQQKQEIANLKQSIKAQKRESAYWQRKQSARQPAQAMQPTHSVQTQTTPAIAESILDEILDDNESEGWVSC